MDQFVATTASTAEMYLGDRGIEPRIHRTRSRVYNH